MGNRQAGLHRAAAPLASGSGPDSTEQDRFLAAQLQVPVRLVGREPVGIAEVDQVPQLLTHDLEALGRFLRLHTHKVRYSRSVFLPFPDVGVNPVPRFSLHPA